MWRRRLWGCGVVLNRRATAEGGRSAASMPLWLGAESSSSCYSSFGIGLREGGGGGGGGGGAAAAAAAGGSLSPSKSKPLPLIISCFSTFSSPSSSFNRNNNSANNKNSNNSSGNKNSNNSDNNNVINDKNNNSISRSRVATSDDSSNDNGKNNENSDNNEKGEGEGEAGEKGKGKGNGNADLTLTLTCEEAKRLMRLVNVESLKMKLGMEGKEVIPYSDLIEACRSMGVARSLDEAVSFARVLDDAGVILLFRDKVYLHPEKVVDLVRRAVPLALTPEDDPMRDELKRLQEKKEEIDVMAHKQVQRILWGGLAMAVLQVGLFFRLTFWEFSWDVMEPIAFFTTTTGLIVGYAYFLFTSRDPTYQDLMKRLFLSRQRKLFKKLNFDVDRLRELHKKCKTPPDASASIKNRVGVELDLEDALHKD